MLKLDRWFDPMFEDWNALTPALPARMAVPSVDVKEKDDRFLVKVDVPGIAKKDLKVRVEGKQLSIEGCREEEKKEEDAKKGYLRSERYYGSFCRVISLPSEVKAEDVKADYTDGVLNLDMPKVKANIEKGKTIPIA